MHCLALTAQRHEALSMNCSVNIPWSLHLQCRRSRCRARCNRGPPGTCLQPRWGTHSRGSWSQTYCRSLFTDKETWHYTHRTKHHHFLCFCWHQNKSLFTTESYLCLSIHWLLCSTVIHPSSALSAWSMCPHHSPCSQYGSPSSRWKVLFLIGCWQEAHRKQ